MDEELKREIWQFMDENRTRALWWMRKGYYPETGEEARAVLKNIASRGDRAAFVRAMLLRRRVAV